MKFPTTIRSLKSSITINQPPAARIYPLAINGIFSLRAIQKGLLYQQIRLVYPAGKGKKTVYLYGHYDSRRIARQLELQIGCQAIRTENIITLQFPGKMNNKAMLIEPDIFPKTFTLDGTQITRAKGMAILQVPYRNLANVRRIIRQLKHNTPTIELTAILVDDDRANNFDGQLNPTLNQATGTTNTGTAGNTGSLNTLSLANLLKLTTFYESAQVTLNIFHQAGIIVTQFQTMLEDGQKEQYQDTTNRMTQQFTTIANSNAGLLQSGTSNQSAGTTITITATRENPNRWEIKGDIKISNFLQPGPLSDTEQRSIKFQAELQAHSMNRVATMTVNTRSANSGIEANAPGFAHDSEKHTFSLWIGLSNPWKNQHQQESPVTPLPAGWYYRLRRLGITAQPESRPTTRTESQKPRKSHLMKPKNTEGNEK